MKAIIYRLLMFALILPCILVQAQDYSAALIPDSIKENANAVVRHRSISIEQTDVKNATFKYQEVITILNSRGNYLSNISISGSKHRELKKFSGKVYNADGKEVRKMAKKDLHYSSYSQHLSTDAYSESFNCHYSIYPYTVVYEYEQQWKNGIISYGSFYTHPAYNVAVQNAEYKLEVPSQLNIRHRANYDSNLEIIKHEKSTTYQVSANNLKALEKEPYSPSFSDIRPYVQFVPTQFFYDGIDGDMSNWLLYGQWVNKLLEGRDELPADEVAKLQSLVAGAENDRQKVKMLYEHLQNNTRYVSIQLGIGGFQPIDATSTLRSKYGDCKGLSNLMKAMLKAINIEARYCEIGVNRKPQFNSEFMDFTQTDHAIVMVPLSSDTIWLECTSQTLPFGFIHSGIAGHDALAMEAQGGIIYRLPNYSSKQNKQVSKVEITITDDEAPSKLDFSFTENMLGYDEHKYLMTSKKREDQIKYLNYQINLPKLSAGEITVNENKCEQPSCTLSTTIEADKYVTRTGQRIFVPLSPLRKSSLRLPKTSKRDRDIVMHDNYSESDSIIINIPQGYEIESAPKNVVLETAMGSLFTNINIENPAQIIYQVDFSRNAGTFDKEKYAELKKLSETLSKASIQKLVLKKINN